jgi:hypothetical protein
VPLTLEAIKDAIKRFSSLKQSNEASKAIGLRAGYLKFVQPEYYSRLSVDDKFYVDNAIKVASDIIKEERLVDKISEVRSELSKLTRLDLGYIHRYKEEKKISKEDLGVIEV